MQNTRNLNVKYRGKYNCGTINYFVLNEINKTRKLSDNLGFKFLYYQRSAVLQKERTVRKWGQNFTLVHNCIHWLKQVFI